MNEIAPLKRLRSGTHNGSERQCADIILVRTNATACLRTAHQYGVSNLLRRRRKWEAINHLLRQRRKQVASPKVDRLSGPRNSSLICEIDVTKAITRYPCRTAKPQRTRGQCCGGRQLVLLLLLSNSRPEVGAVVEDLVSFQASKVMKQVSDAISLLGWFSKWHTSPQSTVTDPSRTTLSTMCLYIEE